MAHVKHAPNGSGLVAVLLITRSRPGPKLVFHYPERPYLPPKRRRRDDPDSDDSSDSEDDEDEKASEATAKDNNPVTAPMKGNRYVLPDEANPDLKDGNLIDEVSKVLGHSVESLEKVLSPGRWSDRKKFEINLDGLTFIGHPIYAAEDGLWGPKQPGNSTLKAPKKSGSKDSQDALDLDIDSLDLTSPKPPSTNHRRDHDFTHVPDSLDSQKDLPFGTSVETTSSANSGSQIEQINMFQVVFVMRGAGPTAQKEAKSIYSDVAKRLNEALEYCQRQADYVARESRRLLTMRSKQREDLSIDGANLWQRMVEGNELAWALKEVYEKISTGVVAGIRLNGMDMSLYLESLAQDPSSKKVELGPLSALLLLEPKEILLRELAHPDASPLATFIRECTPAKNLTKKALHLNISLDEVLYMSSHLVKWRKARVLSQPLNARNTYVVSPDAPLDDLEQHISAYHKLFPTLPNLPNMLKVLSGRPIKYGLLIPSRDHRTAYMDILSYLVRNGFVVQLRTYGWLKISKGVLERAKPRELPPTRTPLATRSLLSPRSRAVDDDAVSVTSDRTAVASASTISSRDGKRLSSGTQVPVSDLSKPKDEFSIVLKPTEPSDAEAKLLIALRATFHDGDMKDCFDALLKHFDGEHAFEEIAAREGLKRARVEEWLAELDANDHLMTVRYL
ncbi:Nitrogen permease regulator 3 [Pseudocercospora fuligena]|uniref:Nitrogen permease regulator 3 n=1 Tax=Pseudocercospora fuligena TaxID=685502 RepID=A0A8H6R969_9PEZI|nr:Nitrogen permease regulator 3 [Pseudocercospora fuligena]